MSAFSMSWKRRRDLSSTQVTMKLPQHSLSADCVTRWGSTGKMVGRIREQQEAINFVLGNDRKASHLVLNWQQKDVLEAIDKTLSPLKKMTDLLSGEDYVTISAIKPMLHHIFEDILKSEENDVSLTKDMKKIIKDDLEGRYSSANGEINLIMNLSNFIDPRFRADYLSDDELALVKEEITVDIDVMDMMDHDSQDNTNDE